MPLLGGVLNGQVVGGGIEVVEAGVGGDAQETTIDVTAADNHRSDGSIHIGHVIRQRAVDGGGTGGDVDPQVLIGGAGDLEPVGHLVKVNAELRSAEGDAQRRGGGCRGGQGANGKERA